MARRSTPAQRSILERMAAGERLCYGINSGWGFIGRGPAVGQTASSCLRQGWVEQAYAPDVTSLRVYRLSATGRAALEAK